LFARMVPAMPPPTISIFMSCSSCAAGNAMETTCGND
jgi:hypothetical protein